MSLGDAGMRSGNGGETIPDADELFAEGAEASGGGEDVSDGGEAVSGNVDGLSGDGEDVSSGGEAVSGNVDGLSGDGEDVSGDVDGVSGAREKFSGDAGELFGSGAEVIGDVDGLSGTGEDFHGDAGELFGSGAQVSGTTEKLHGDGEALSGDGEEASSDAGDLLCVGEDVAADGGEVSCDGVTLSRERWNRARGLNPSAPDPWLYFMAQAIHVVPKMPVRAPRFLRWAKAVNARLDGHPTFKSPAPTLAALIACVEGLDEAETLARTKASGSVTERDDELEAAKRQYRHLVDYVQSVVEKLGYDEALAAAESIGFALRKPPKRNKQALEVRQGRVSGEAALIAKAVAYLAMYYWEMSEDKEHWTCLPETHQASTTTSGLTPGQVYYFRFRVQKRRGGKSDYTQIVSFRAS